MSLRPRGFRSKLDGAHMAYELALPEDASFCLSMAVGLPVTIMVYLLLYKDGATANRRKQGRR